MLSVIVHMNYIIEGKGALIHEAGDFVPVNEARKETALKTGDFALVNPDEKHQDPNKREPEGRNSRIFLWQ